MPSIISGVASNWPGVVPCSSSGVSQCFHCQAGCSRGTLRGVDVGQRRVALPALIAAVVQPLDLARRRLREHHGAGADERETDHESGHGTSPSAKPACAAPILHRGFGQRSAGSGAGPKPGACWRSFAGGTGYREYSDRINSRLSVKPCCCLPPPVAPKARSTRIVLAPDGTRVRLSTGRSPVLSSRSRGDRRSATASRRSAARYR